MLSRLWFVSVLVVSTVGKVAAEPATPLLTHGEIDREDRVRLDADEQRIQQQHVELLQAKYQREREQHERELVISEHERERAIRRSRRSAGIGFAVSAGVFGALTAVAAYLGKRENRDIQQPGLATPADITGAARRGVIYNDVAYGCGIAAGLSAIVAVPLITLNLDPGEIEVHATGGAGAGGVSLSGRF